MILLYMVFFKEISATFFVGITNPTIKHFFTILIFSVAYLVRPFAGTVLGMLGDLLGRRYLLLFTILLMGTCSLLMGLIPGYEKWGLLSSFTFISLRILQGFALGGELPGAYVIVYESVKNHVGFAFAVLFSFITAGLLLSNIIGFSLEFIFGDYAWRAGFILGGLLGFIGYYFRRTLHETPEFEKIDNQKRHSFISLVSTYGANLLAGICIVIVVAFGGVMLFAYLHAFVEGILTNYSSGEISLILIPSISIYFVSTLVFGYLSDKIGIAKMFILGTSLIIFVSLPIFYLMTYFASAFSIVVTSIIIMLCYSFVIVGFIFLLCDLFPTDIRVSGVGISYNLAFATIGGIGPVLSTIIINTTQYYFLGPSIVGIICGTVGLLGIFLYFKKGGYHKYNKDMKVKL
ncbi:MAG: MFS transporter [Francisella sp.]